MKVRISALLAVAGLASGCGGQAGPPTAPTHGSPTPTVQPAVATSAAPPSAEMMVCAEFTREVLPDVAKAASEGIGTGAPNPPYSWAERTLLKDESKLTHWSYTVRSAANGGDLQDPDAVSFADFLGSAGIALGVVAGPYSTAADADAAATDVGEVNGYCKYDVG
jgi:hypothetical protein